MESIFLQWLVLSTFLNVYCPCFEHHKQIPSASIVLGWKWKSWRPICYLGKTCKTACMARYHWKEVRNDTVKAFINHCQCTAASVELVSFCMCLLHPQNSHFVDLWWPVGDIQTKSKAPLHIYGCWERPCLQYIILNIRLWWGDIWQVSRLP